MASTSWRGIAVPGIGDDLLGAFGDLATDAGVITRVESVAAARALLTAATSAGAVINMANPAYFDIGGVFYRCVGKNSSAVWVLAPFNEVEVGEKTYANGKVHDMPANWHSPLLTADLSAKPYDRVVIAYGYAWGNVISGQPDLALYVGSTDQYNFARFDTYGGNQGSTVTVVNSGIIRAGVVPDIALNLYAWNAPAKVQLDANGRWNRLMWQAMPISMG